VDPKYGQKYRELYERHWWWRAREDAVLKTLRAHQPAEGWGRILDVGCGDGLFFDRLLELGDVEGVEPDAALVRTDGPHRARIQIVPFNASFRSGKQYSLILMLDVLEHMPDPVAAVCHARSLLIPGGALLATVPAFNLLWTNHDTINHHVTRYRRATLRPLFSQAGLHILEERYLFQWMFPAKLLTRAVERILATRPAVPSVPPNWLNQSLLWISRLERKLLSHFPVPLGSSLVVLVKKPS
jgi:2-polyprenyl-3-methyl-5-hydroxy-6-metoxy-1,4-benzoquinol methylase